MNLAIAKMKMEAAAQKKARLGMFERVPHWKNRQVQVTKLMKLSIVDCIKH